MSSSFDNLLESDKFLQDFFSEEDFSNMKELFSNKYSEENFYDNISYLKENFFQKESQIGMDFDYIKEVGKKFNSYIQEVQEKVDYHVDTFYYKEMDIIDRVIFLLGYIEYKELETPKEIILNEMIELSKRYGDDGSLRLINGIGDKIIN